MSHSNADWPGDAPRINSLNAGAHGSLIVEYGNSTTTVATIRVYPVGYIDVETPDGARPEQVGSQHINHAIRIWRAMTGNWETTFTTEEPEWAEMTHVPGHGLTEK